MAKAKAGQSARKRQERERERAAHLEAIIEELPERSTLEVDPQPETHDDVQDTVAGRPHAGDEPSRGSVGLTDDDHRDSPPHWAHHADANPDIQAGPDRSINAPPVEMTNVLRDTTTVSGDLMRDEQPAFAPVPAVPADSSAAGATDMDASQSAPRGRMTDRYTVWSGSAIRPADAAAEVQRSGTVVHPSEPSHPATATPDSHSTDGGSGGSGDTGGSAGRQEQGATDDQRAPSAGIDLAMSRLRSATGDTGRDTGVNIATAGGDVGAAEAALDVAVDQFGAATRTVETSISEAASTSGAMPSPDGGDQASDTTDTGEDASAEHTGIAGLLDDLAGRLGSAREAVDDALDQSRDDATDGMDAASGENDDPAQRAGGFIQQGRNRASETVDQVGSTVADAAAGLKDSADEALGRARAAGSDIAGSVREASQSTRDDLVEVAGQVSDRAQAAGGDVAATLEDSLDKAEDRVEQAAEEIAETTATAAQEVSGAVGRAIHDVRDQVTGTAHDLVTIGRDAVTDARTIATDTAADLRSGITDVAGSIAETGRAAAGAVTGRAAEATQSLTGSASEAASGLAGTLRAGLNRSDAAPADTVVAETSGAANRGRGYNRLIVSAVAVGTVSGFNRWAVRRLTGTDIALLGPATIHPAILGTGLAALIASLYLTEE